MNGHIKYYINALANLNLSLQKKGILIDKPWALVDGDGEIQKLIFKKDKGLILSKNGKVTIGNWDYFPEAKALLINRVTDILLLKEQFIDENIIVLKKDGTDNSFFALVNENTIPDYNILGYLNRLKCKAFNIYQKRLLSGNTLEIYNYEDGYAFTNLRVQMIDDNFDTLRLEDGKYLTANKRQTFYISNNRVSNVTNNELRELEGGEIFEIENGMNKIESCNMNNYNRKNINKRITINGKSVGNTHLTDKGNSVYEIKDSVIADILFPYDYELRTGQKITILQRDYKKFRKGDKIVDSKPFYPLPDGTYKLKGYMFLELEIKNCVII